MTKTAIWRGFRVCHFVGDVPFPYSNRPVITVKSPVEKDGRNYAKTVFHYH